MIKQRIKKFWQEIAQSKQQLPAFLVTNPKNIFYLTEFTGEGILLATLEKNYLITDSRYTEQAKQETHNCQIIMQEMKKSGAQTESLCRLIRELRLEEVGFESASLQVGTYLQYQNLMPHLPLTPFPNLIESIRMIKDYKEIELLKKSTQIAIDAFIQTIPSLQSGNTEVDIAAWLSYAMRKNGAQKDAFDIIVTSGERGTLIHGTPSSKELKENELIILDFGCVVDMYHSDCTRTLLLGHGHKEQRKIFDLVKQTQMETLEQVKAGKRCSELDGFARKKIEKNGYGDYFSHSLGHGVGLDIHESPRLSFYDHTILQPGMVVTIEPGIYVPDVGGVRIEDTVVVTEEGCEILTGLPKELSLAAYLKK